MSGVSETVKLHTKHLSILLCFGFVILDIMGHCLPSVHRTKQAEELVTCVCMLSHGFCILPIHFENSLLAFSFKLI